MLPVTIILLKQLYAGSQIYVGAQSWHYQRMSKGVRAFQCVQLFMSVRVHECVFV